MPTTFFIGGMEMEKDVENLKKATSVLLDLVIENGIVSPYEVMLCESREELIKLLESKLEENK